LRHLLLFDRAIVFHSPGLGSAMSALLQAESEPGGTGLGECMTVQGSSRASHLARAAAALAIALLAHAAGPLGPVTPASAQSNDAEMRAFADAEARAFEAAKELGTVDAWNAFLANHADGFYADLARAYLKKLADSEGAPAAEANERPGWCAKPRHAAERAICREPDLTSLDHTMNVAYKRAKFDSPGKHEEIDHEQRRWLSRRDLCGDDAACIGKRYDEQIQFLESFFEN
jgi:uncharacterized protein YecT (DUF1311 family)